MTNTPSDATRPEAESGRAPARGDAEGAGGHSEVRTGDSADLAEPSSPALPDPNSPRITPDALPIEIGWVIGGRLDKVDYEAARQSRGRVLNLLNHAFTQFAWRMPLVERPEMVSAAREEPVTLLDDAAAERESHCWDFVLLLTPVDLTSHYKPFALAVVSRAIDTAVVSTARIDPFAVDTSLPQDERVAALTQRITALVLHAIGHLNGLAHAEEAANWMFDVRTVTDLDGMQSWNEDQVEYLRGNFHEIADVRLEERRARPNIVSFYLQSAFINWHEIADAVWEARPWQFPARLSRLTTAAVSAAVILMLTAETWDLALSQSAMRVGLLLLFSLLFTTIYVMRRQQLLVRRTPARLSEQSVIANVSTVCIVLGGMMTSLALMFAATLGVGVLWFHEGLIAGWAAAREQPVGLAQYLLMAAFVSSLSILIGALGATFEQHSHFRHITFVDEEV